MSVAMPCVDVAEAEAAIRAYCDLGSFPEGTAEALIAKVHANPDGKYHEEMGGKLARAIQASHVAPSVSRVSTPAGREEELMSPAVETQRLRNYLIQPDSPLNQCRTELQAIDRRGKGATLEVKAADGTYRKDYVEAEVRKELDELLKLKLPVKVMVIGNVNSGKSTLLNALLHKRNLLPTDSIKCTAQITVLNYAPPGHEYVRLVTHARAESCPRRMRKSLAPGDDRQESECKCGPSGGACEVCVMEDEWTATLQSCSGNFEEGHGIQGQELHDRVSHDRRGIFSKLVADNGASLRASGCGDDALGSYPSFGTLPNEGESVLFRSAEERAAQRRRIMDDGLEVQIGVPEEVLKCGFTLVDSPGLNDSQSLTQLVQLHMTGGVQQGVSIPQADAVLYVIDHQGLQMSDKDTLSKIKGDVSQRLMAVVTKMDNFESKSAWRDYPEDSRRMFEKEQVEKRDRILKKAFDDLRKMGLALLQHGDSHTTCPYFHAVSAEKALENSLVGRELPPEFANFEHAFITFLKPTFFSQLSHVCDRLTYQISNYDKFFLVDEHASKLQLDLLNDAEEPLRGTLKEAQKECEELYTGLTVDDHATLDRRDQLAKALNAFKEEFKLEFDQHVRDFQAFELVAGEHDPLSTAAGAAAHGSPSGKRLSAKPDREKMQMVATELWNYLLTWLKASPLEAQDRSTAKALAAYEKKLNEILARMTKKAERVMQDLNRPLYEHSEGEVAFKMERLVHDTFEQASSVRTHVLKPEWHNKVVAFLVAPIMKLLGHFQDVKIWKKFKQSLIHHQDTWDSKAWEAFKDSVAEKFLEQINPDTLCGERSKQVSNYFEQVHDTITRRKRALEERHTNNEAVAQQWGPLKPIYQDLLSEAFLTRTALRTFADGNDRQIKGVLLWEGALGHVERCIQANEKMRVYTPSAGRLESVACCVQLRYRVGLTAGNDGLSHVHDPDTRRARMLKLGHAMLHAEEQRQALLKEKERAEAENNELIQRPDEMFNVALEQEARMYIERLQRQNDKMSASSPRSSFERSGIELDATSSTAPAAATSAITTPVPVVVPTLQQALEQMRRTPEALARASAARDTCEKQDRRKKITNVRLLQFVNFKLAAMPKVLECLPILHGQPSSPGCCDTFVVRIVMPSAAAPDADAELVQIVQASMVKYKDAREEGNHDEAARLAVDMVRAIASRAKDDKDVGTFTSAVVKQISVYCFPWSLPTQQHWSKDDGNLSTMTNPGLVFALGVLLTTLLTGGNEVATQQEPASWIESIHCGNLCEGALRLLLSQCLAKDANERISLAALCYDLDLVLSRRSFASSSYKSAWDLASHAEDLKGQYLTDTKVMDMVMDTVDLYYATRAGGGQTGQTGQADRLKIVKEFHDACKVNMNQYITDRGAALKSPQMIAVMVWTCATRVNEELEFCSILNALIREDNDGANLNSDRQSNPHVRLCYCLNKMLVPIAGVEENMRATVRSTLPVMPLDKILDAATNVATLWRGMVMPRVELDCFFRPGRLYRVPMLLATSSNEKIAHNFVKISCHGHSEGLAACTHVPIIFQFSATRECVNINEVADEHRLVKEKEFEWIFPAYSTFVVTDTQAATVTVEPDDATATVDADGVKDPYCDVLSVQCTGHPCNSTGHGIPHATARRALENIPPELDENEWVDYAIRKLVSIVQVRVMDDNKKERNDLPLSQWH